MYQGTTPAITFHIDGWNMSGMTPFVSFKKQNDLLTKTGDDVAVTYDHVNTRTVVVCKLTQEETLAMKQGKYVTQIRFIDSNDEAYATAEAEIDVNRVIYQEVIRYGGGG